jgi:hypothetical protein
MNNNTITYTLITSDLASPDHPHIYVTRDWAELVKIHAYWLNKATPIDTILLVDGAFAGSRAVHKLMDEAEAYGTE